LPEVADSSLPSASAWAQARQIELPFTDFDSLKAFVIGAFKEEANYLKDVATFARNATRFNHIRRNWNCRGGEPLL